MKKVLFILLILFTAQFGFGQSESIEEKEVTQTFMIVEKMPLYDGAINDEDSNKKLERFVTNRAKAIEVKDKGIVYVSFTVDSEGNVVNVKVLKGVSEKTDEAALSIINDMKPWVAGSQRGKKASVIFNVPVRFK
jgi:TonB family protein